MFALVDCNNFYASCERVFNPLLNGKPVVILSNNDGCVIARSNEAKSFVPMGAPAFKYQQIFDKEKIHVFSSNYALYGDMSKRVMDTLVGFSPDVEIYSIDEAFLQFQGFEHYFDLRDYGLNIRKTVTRNTGIPISVGLANTKTLSKVANKIAKKFPEKTQSVHVIDTEELRIKALKWTKIEDVWGIGRQLTKKLQQKGVTTAFDFTQLPDDWVQKELSIVGLRLKRELEGIPTLGLEKVSKKKNIATTRSFDGNYTEFEQLRERVSTFACSCAQKLRNQESCCNALMLFIHTNGFSKGVEQYNKSIIVKLPYASNSNYVLTHYATLALKKIFKEGYKYKKAGVIVLDFVPESLNQTTLFEKPNEKHKVVMKALDALNTRYGAHKVKLAAQGLGRTWKMKQEKLSPNYTTQFSDIISVKA